MRLTVPFGGRTIWLDVDAQRAEVQVARAADPGAAGSWEDVVAASLVAPIGALPIEAQDLRGKRVTVITDDWGRPTPAHRVVPLLLERLSRTGVADDDVTFVTASGMHDPMTRDDLVRKLGADVVARYRCVSHDAGDWEMLRFVGISAMGTPVWANRYVVDADYVVGLGRVALHVTHGYEGGYKLILPGVSGFDTILRDHSFNYALDSVPGLHENPSRAETDAVGRMVGIDFLINVVANRHDEPVAAFAGAVEPVHQRAMAFGDAQVWGAEVGRLVDVTVASHGPGLVPGLGFDHETVRRACQVTKPGGVVIVMGSPAFDALPDWRAGRHADDRALEQLDRDRFGTALRDLAFSELMRLHERRDWPLSPREIQWRAKSIRGEFYRRRWLMAAEAVHLCFTQDPQAALDAALAAIPAAGSDLPVVLILPDGRVTLPKVAFHVAVC